VGLAQLIEQHQAGFDDAFRRASRTFAFRHGGSRGCGALRNQVYRLGRAPDIPAT
jgi:hypothetical protein